MGGKWSIHVRRLEDKMASMNFDEEGLLDEPCLSCDNSYLEDLWDEWCCDEKECPYQRRK